MGRLFADMSNVGQRTLDALIELQSEQPYESISIVSICTRAGISRQTFYRHYKCKEDVYLAHLDFLLDEVFSCEQGGMSLDGLFDSMGQLLAGNRRFLVSLFRANLDSRVLYRFERLLISMGSVSGFGPNEQYMQTFLAGGTFNTMKRWAIQNTEVDARVFADALRELCSPIVESTRKRLANRR